MSIRVLLFAAVAAFVGFPWVVDVYTDWLWFLEVGYGQVFLDRVSAQLIVGVTAALPAAVLLVSSFWYALRAMSQPYLVLGPASVEVRPLVLQRGQLRMVTAAIGLGLGLLLGLAASAEWLTWLLVGARQPFGEVDPVLGRDVSFYVFVLPALDHLRAIALIVVVLALIGSGGIYVLTGALRLDPQRGVSVLPAARRHLSLVAALLFVVLTLGAWLGIAQLLTSPSGIVHGASYTDVAVRIPALYVLTAVSALGAVLAVVHGFSRSTWPLVIAGVAYVVVSLGGELAATAVQRFTVAPNELVRETPYIVHHIEATRRAFGLGNVEERELSGDALLTRDDIDRHAETLRNVRLWDHQPLLDTFGQIQEIRTYYDFASVDNDRYVIDGQLRQVMLSARELNSDSLPNRTWINERLVFTHGYGVALGPVNQVTQEGLPVLFIKNLPPESSVDLTLEEPSIYYGERSSDHVFVRTKAREFHYPKGDDNVYATYEGRGGVSVDGFWRKLLFALRFRSLKILLSDDIGPESRVMFHRQIGERVTTIAPFVTYDSDPYLVVADGRLYWMWDAYTTSARYPYSALTGRINYIRNSVKVVIDAYDGRVGYYLADPDDPIVKALSEVFPDLFQPLDAMPPSLRSHVRYPEDIFAVQTVVYSTFHMTNPEVFYNKEDQWEVPAIEMEGQPVTMQPYYTIMRLPGETSNEFIQMLPFTPRRKDNLAAWMVARSDGEHYGRILVFQFPKQKVVFGPRQVVGRINQDQVISPQITLWNQQGSQVIQGTLLVIPIEESLLYIRPLYLRAAGGRIPELKRVIVAYQNQIVMSETLEEAIDRIFGRAGETPEPATAAAAAAAEDVERTGDAPRAGPPLSAEAWQHYQRALKAQREGDWATYGEEIRRVGEILERLARSQGRP